MPPRVFGPIPGIPVGAIFPDRRALAAAGAHHPLQAGISGSSATPPGDAATGRAERRRLHARRRARHAPLLPSALPAPPGRLLCLDQRGSSDRSSRIDSISASGATVARRSRRRCHRSSTRRRSPRSKPSWASRAGAPPTPSRYCSVASSTVPII
ncbi:MAG: hypothetical protein HY329_27850 [Chloroflexi bacterium]|nr:hypothetical protein [Chloroflexota bacterium]